MSRGPFGRVAAGGRNLARGAGAAVESRLNETTIRLAVTGLSRAGKTVFITSLIQNLLALGQGAAGGVNTLPRLVALLSEHGGYRLRGVKVVPARAERTAQFDFAGKLASLAADAPTWPPRTEELAQIALHLDLVRRSALGRTLGFRRIRLEILDYPGEWLLDLPLLDQTFEEWSASVLASLAEPPRRQYAAPFLDFIAGLRANGPAEDSLIRRGHLLYREALLACREKLGLRYLQPGRFLTETGPGDMPFLWFFPLHGSGDPYSGSIGTTAALLTERFEAYKAEIRENFFDSHFRSFNRQIMLVDVLGALHGGRAAFEDTVHAVADLARGLRDGWGFWSRQRRRSLARNIVHGAGAARTLIRRAPNPLILPVIGLAGRVLASVVSPRPIERVAFVATKADHVPALARDNLQHLLHAMADPAARDWQAANTQVSFHVAASILSTEDGTAKLDGQTVQVVRGTVLGEDIVRPFYVGAVPSQIPPPSFWSDRYFEMPVFRPPAIDPTGAHGIPHLGLDDILVAVIGDLL